MITVEDFKSLILPLTKIMKFAPDFREEGTSAAYYKALRDFDRDKLEQACTLASRTLNEFPSIKQLYDLCQNNVLKDEEVGEDIATNIMYCIGLFGRNAMQEKNRHRQDLIDRLGDLAIEIVKEFNGWENICLLAENNKEAIFLKRNIKEVATIKYKKLNAIGTDNPMALPKSPIERSDLLNNALKLIRKI